MLAALAHRAALALPPMLAHRLALRVLASGLPVAWRAISGPAVSVAGLSVPGPVGLAAGFDKDAVALPGLVRLGFGHIEVGTVTPRPQRRNPGRPLVRLREDRALVNRLGMPGDGASAVAARLRRFREGRPDCPVRIGASVGANRDSIDIATDVAQCIAMVGPYADFLTVNLSSPNTAGLRDWQAGARLARVLDAAAAARAALPRRAPLFVKIAPDIDPAAEAGLVERVIAAGLDGIVLCNTTTERPAGLRSPRAAASGGLSGAPLTARALAQLVRVRGLAGDRLALIATGGVMTAADALARLEAGAALVQVMTGWIYRGPRLLDEIGAALAGRAAVTPARPRSLPQPQPDPLRP